MQTSLPSLKSAYQNSNVLSDSIWEIVQYWSVFNRSIIGQYFINSLDNFSINIALAIKTKSPTKKNYHLNLAYNNLLESMLWNEKSRRRQLLDKQNYETIYVQLMQLQATLLNKKTKTKQRPKAKNIKKQ
jgi:four helix bundle protein